MGGRGSSGGSGGGKITFQQAREMSKQLKSLNQRIGRLQSNINIVNGKIPFIGVTEAGRKQLRSAQKTYNSDVKKLASLQSERNTLQKKLQRYQRQR